VFKKLTAAALALGFLVVPAASSSGASCSFSSVSGNRDLGTLYASVVDTTTGKKLIGVRDSEQTPSASVMKLFTGAASIMYLPSDYRAETSVWTVDQDPGTLVLHGGGDHALSRLVSPHYTTYAKPARLSNLATRTLAAIPANMKIRRIILDDSFFEGTAYNPWWFKSDRVNGYISPITGLAVDSARVNPDLTDKKYDGTRVADPVWQAGQEFRKALGDRGKGARFDTTMYPWHSYKKVASVLSSPVTTWIDHAMKVSDNTETEYLIRHVLKASSRGTDYTDIQPQIEGMLESFGISAKGLVMKDAAGLAQDDRVTAKMVTALLNEGAQPGSPIASLGGYLATTSSIGTISSRFRGANAVVRGKIQAKTGFIPGVYSLAGYVTAKDGHRIAWAFFARGKGIGGGTRTAIDSLVVRAYTCGAKLTK